MSEDRAQRTGTEAEGPHQGDGRGRRRSRSWASAGPGDAQGPAARRPELDDIGLIEINEAFAAQALAVIQLLGADPETTTTWSRNSEAALWPNYQDAEDDAAEATRAVSRRTTFTI